MTQLHIRLHGQQLNVYQTTIVSETIDYISASLAVSPADL